MKCSDFISAANNTQSSANTTADDLGGFALDVLKLKVSNIWRVAQVKVRILVAGLLLTLSVARVSTQGEPATATSIENPTCELIRASVYRIDFEASKDAGPVEAFLSSRPDRVDSEKPLVTIRKTPAEVSVAGSSGRIYFSFEGSFRSDACCFHSEAFRWRARRIFAISAATAHPVAATFAGAWCTVRIILPT